MVAIRVRDEPVFAREGLSLRLPEAQVAERAVDEHDRRALPFVDVCEIDAVGAQLAGLRRRGGLGGNERRGAGHHESDCRPDGF